jgi:hypothetical protein
MAGRCDNQPASLHSWRNWFLGIDSWASETSTNSGFVVSARIKIRALLQYQPYCRRRLRIVGAKETPRRRITVTSSFNESARNGMGCGGLTRTSYYNSLLYRYLKTTGTVFPPPICFSGITYLDGDTQPLPTMNVKKLLPTSIHIHIYF